MNTIHSQIPTKKNDTILLLLLFFIFFFGAAGLMLFSVYKDPTLHGDGASVAIVAKNLAQGKGYTVDYIMYFVEDYPEISHHEDIWPIGIPTIVSIFFKLFGVSTFIAKLPNILLFLLFVATLFYILKRKYNASIAFFASIFTLVNVNLFKIVREPYHDIAFLICVNLSLITLSLWWGEQKKKYLILLGFFTGLTILFKYTGLLLLPFCMFIILLRLTKKDNMIKNIVKSTFLFVLISLVVASPWFIRNTILFSNPIYSVAGIISPLTEVPGTQPDESFRILFNESNIKPLKQAGILDKIVNNLKSWNSLGRKLRKDEIVPGVLLFLFLFGLVLLNWNEFEMNVVRIYLSFIFVYVLFIIYYIHLEARYFVWMIPFISFIGAKLLHYFYTQITKTSYKIVYILIICFLLFYVTYPFVSEVYYGSKKVYDYPLYQFIENNTPSNAVVMSRLAPVITWNTERKAVMVPFGEVSDFYMIIKKYNVTHVLIADPLWEYATSFNVRPWVFDLNKMVGNNSNKPLFNNTLCNPEIDSRPCLYSVDVTVVHTEEDIKVVEGSET